MSRKITSGSERTHKTEKRLGHIPGQMILRVRSQSVMAHVMSVRSARPGARAAALPESVEGPLEYLRKNAGLKSIKPIFSSKQKPLQAKGMKIDTRIRMATVASVADSSSEDLMGFTMVTIDPKKLTPALMKHIKASPALEVVEPMPARWLAAKAADPQLNRQWGLRAINWFQANLPKADKIKVAVLDTGVDEDHPDLEGQIAAYYHKGLKRDDLLGYGTHVCGIIAAVVNNGVGIAGVADCQLEVWKIFDDKPEHGDFYVNGERYFQALNAVRNSGARALNLSIGGGEKSQTEALLFRRLIAANVCVVAAMGNEYEEGNPIEYPGAYPGVLAVGAINEVERRASFSNTGKHIGIMAPGANILSTLPMKTSAYRDESEYEAWNGTSMATPHVCAAAGLVSAKNSGWSASKVKDRLTSTARKLAIMKGKAWTPSYGHGVLDLDAAL